MSVAHVKVIIIKERSLLVRIYPSGSRPTHRDNQLNFNVPTEECYDERSILSEKED